MQISESLDNASVTDTLKFWAVRLLVLLASLWGSKWLLFDYADQYLQQPKWLKPVLLLPTVAALFMTAAELYLEFHFPMTADHDDSDMWQQTPVLAVLGEYLTIISYLLTINGVIWLLLQWQQQSPQLAVEEAVADSVITPKFMQKIPHIDFAKVFAINADGHYIQVHHSEGTELIHYVFKQAVQEVPPAHGSQTHRSWWVAKQAVSKARKSGKRYRLILDNTLEVPVSDTFVKQVRAAGLLNK